jgi:RNA polymerase sigma-70 factor, ECF subfamily
LNTVELKILANSLSGPRSSAPVDAADHALIERAKHDPDAFGRLFEIYYLSVLRFVYRCTWNRAVAEDLTSATFLKALGALRRYDHRARFSTWLYRIATNEVRMHWRAQARALAARRTVWRAAESCSGQADASSVDVREAAQEHSAQESRLRQAVGRLPDRYRTVIALRYFEGLSCEMVAEVLQKRIGTVKSLIHRGIKRLRTILDEGDSL